MYYRKPSYYDAFSCAADRCPDTCCAGWNIVIDDKTMADYRSLPEDARRYVMSHVDEKEQVYIRNNARCSFLNERNLCDLYTCLGEKMFCKTCRRYPRHFEEYGNLVEAALSMSCPVAADMIVNREDRDRYVVKNDEKKSPHANEVDHVLLGSLLGARQHIFDIMADRKTDIRQRMKRILIYGAKLQKLVYQYEKLGWRVKRKTCAAFFMVKADTLAKKESLHAWETANAHDNRENAGNRQMRAPKEERYVLMQQYLDMLLGLENINAAWPSLVEEVQTNLYTNQSAGQYTKLAGEFDAYMEKRNHEYEHILNYFIYTYFLGGVYDYNVQAMIKFAVLSVLIIREIGMCTWLKNQKKFSVEDQLHICWLYSRQIEHSDDNLMALEGILNAHPLFCENNFIKVL